MKLPVPTDNTPELCHYANVGFDRIFRPGYRYKKVGVWLSNLVVPTAVQQHLFDPDPQPRHTHLMQVMDELNQKYGKATLRTASAGFRRQEWKLRQQQLSRATPLVFLKSCRWVRNIDILVCDRSEFNEGRLAANKSFRSALRVAFKRDSITDKNVYVTYCINWN